MNEKMTFVSILAVDPSPNGTAVFKLRQDVKSIIEPILVDFWFCTNVKKTKKAYGKNAFLLEKVKQGDESARLNRMKNVHDWFTCLLVTHNPDYVAFEDYVWNPMMHGKGGKKVTSKSTIQIGELGGTLRLEAIKLKIPFRTYEPVTVKLAWTGRGDANKDDMVQRAKDYLVGHDIAGKVLSLPKTNLEDVSDALAVGWLLCCELMVREGTVLVRDLPKNLIRVFNRVTKATPMCLLDRPFVVCDES